MHVEMLVRRDRVRRFYFLEIISKIIPACRRSGGFPAAEGQSMILRFSFGRWTPSSDHGAFLRGFQRFFLWPPSGLLQRISCTSRCSASGSAWKASVSLTTSKSPRMN